MHRLHEPNQQVEGLRPAWGSFDITSLQTYLSDMAWSLDVPCTVTSYLHSAEAQHHLSMC